MTEYRSRQWSWQNPVTGVTLLASVVVCVWLFSANDVWTTAPWLSVPTTALLVGLAFMPLTITGSARGVSVSLAGVLRRDIAAEQITDVERRTYRPIGEFGGWGWRYGLGGGGSRAYTTTGTTAVVLTLVDGSEVFLGVADERALIDALAPARA
ncbi:hypothetical protein [Demequina globuliformis]|uniref:hypothetical protein n=1 Tax=Demequina globuliformis TaxID=676202 RepID=UPI000784FE61|nr:hypothetical protein [Demequina globuliformis]